MEQRHLLSARNPPDILLVSDERFGVRVVDDSRVWKFGEGDGDVPLGELCLCSLCGDSVVMSHLVAISHYFQGKLELSRYFE